MTQYEGFAGDAGDLGERPDPGIGRDELAAIRVLGRVEPPTDAVLAAAQARLAERIGAGQVGVQRHRAGVRRRALVGVLAAAAATAAVITVPTVWSGGRGVPVGSADAAQFLQGVSARAAAQPGDWRTARFWYSRSVVQQDGGPRQTRQIWIGHYSTGRLVTGARPPAHSKPGEPVSTDGSIPIPPDGFPFGGGSTVSWDQLWRLPTDPVALERQLRAARHGAGPDADAELFTAVGDLLRESPAPPALRAALYQVAARVHGVRLVGQVKDALGRTGTAVERKSSGIVYRYVIDPSTGRLLQESTGLLGSACGSAATAAPNVATASAAPGSGRPTGSATGSKTVPATASTTVPATGPKGGPTAGPTAGPKSGSAGAGQGGAVFAGEGGCSSTFSSTYVLEGPVSSDHAVPSAPR